MLMISRVSRSAQCLMTTIFLLTVISGYQMKKLYGNQIEDSYQIPSGQVIRNNFVIISGCSGGGKSSILTELAKKGFLVIPEPGRQIVKEQESISGKGLPWENLDHFLELALSRYIYNYNSQKEVSKYIFFDRGVIDAIQPNCNNNSHFCSAAEKYRYNRKVFLLPPWREIYKNDPQRKHGFEDAVNEYNLLLENYSRFKYEVIIVPKGKIESRIEFILANLK